jgi:hypothetical protein
MKEQSCLSIIKNHLPTFTFEWVKRGRGSIFGIGKDFLIGEDEVLRR